ncbi:MAG: MerR family transcriptional regulator [Desulfobacteraceae bacterium]|jgi:DNA-binding transcriptional MerR regulator|nr:MAG: MerR family transcriptional regulator [Desulfobacteraceae bacterium]
MDNKPKENILLTISDIAEQLDISTRAIRFYEEKGLILPGRTKGNHRVYTRRDRTRLKLIMRGKRLGYSLDEIAEMIGLAEFNKDEIEQLKTSLAFGERKLKEINERMEELMILKQDLLAIQQKIINRLEEIRTGKPSQLIKEAHHGDR